MLICLEYIYINLNLCSNVKYILCSELFINIYMFGERHKTLTFLLPLPRTISLLMSRGGRVKEIFLEHHMAHRIAAVLKCCASQREAHIHNSFNGFITFSLPNRTLCV
jgi:hypothetical protein